MAADTLLAATWLHLGFQLTVTLLVYPVLVAPTSTPQEWSQRHRSHSRHITPVVVLVYGALLVGGAAVLLDGPRTAASLTAVGAALVAVAATAFVAAPAHGRLAGGRDTRVEARLLAADRVRLAAAVAAAVAAALVGLHD